MEGYALGLYEKAFPNELCLQDKLAQTRELGFDQLELSVDESEEKLARLYLTAEKTREMKAMVDGSGTPVSTLCLSGHRKYPMGSHQASVREKSLEMMERALALSCRLGVRVIQLAGYDVYYEEGDGDTEKWFLESLARAAELAAQYGVLLGFETMETPFMDTVGKAMYYVGKINSPYLGIYPDIGNLKNAALLYHMDVVRDLEMGAGRIVAVHLKETAPDVYRDMAPGSTGHTEYERCIKELLSQGVRIFTGEFWHQPGEDHRLAIRAAGAFLRGKIEAARI